MTIDEYLLLLANSTTTISINKTPITITMKEASTADLIALKVFFYIMGAAAFSAVFFLIVIGVWWCHKNYKMSHPTAVRLAPASVRLEPEAAALMAPKAVMPPIAPKRRPPSPAQKHNKMQPKSHL